MKKIIAIFTLILLLTSSNSYFITYAVNTNEQSTPWTMEKAEHLAKKALYGASKEKVLELYTAGNATSAVNILFPSVEGPDRTAYETKMASILRPELLIGTNNSEMREFYTFKKLDDPYEAKSKLMGIFEDTFSVNTIYNRINYQDIEATYDLLYSHTLGNYKEMVKRVLYNNGERGDYSLGEYLNLFDQVNPVRPNENYSREMLQLFLMLEYKPTESEDTNDIRNYSEEDVQSFARILFGFESDEMTHLITYNGASNTNTDIEFLDGNLKIGDSFPFYNTGSGILNIQDMQVPINGNNGLPDNIVDYIFSKRENEIALFLADKMYRYYIASNPARSDLDLIKDKIIAENFEIYPTVKWLLSQDMMYSDKSMNDLIYKNPLELAIGTAKILGLNSEQVNMKYALTNLSWKPYGVGKIFGRDGFDNNSVFLTPYIATKWTTESSLLATSLIDKNLSFFNTGATTATGVINDLEEKIYLGKALDPSTKEKLINYLTRDMEGNEIAINFNDPQYVARNIQGVLYIMLNQPEYVLQSGYDINTIGAANNNNFYDNDSKLILIKASGGLDWMHAFIQKDEYPEYLELRSSGALVGTGLVDLNSEYYMNSALAPFKNTYNDGNLRVINRVGTPEHSRAHDSASRKMTSLNNKYSSTDAGIYGHFVANEDPTKTIVLRGGTKPLIFRSGNYMGIGGTAIFQVYSGNVFLTTTEKQYKIDTLKDILLNRNYNGAFGEVFKNSTIIDTVAKSSKDKGGREGSGYNMVQNYTFLESLYEEGLGNTVWIKADGGYDTHSNQKEGLNRNLAKVAESTADFFNRVKDRYNVTILIYSEFGRTNRLNSSNGVDHGEGGGMLIVSNNTELLTKELPKKVYGNLSMKDSKMNRLGVGIDYRSVYKSVFKGLYNRDISPELKGIFNINDYIDDTKTDLKLHTVNFNNGIYSGNEAEIYFKINDTNFHPEESSYVKFEYGRDKNDMYEYSNSYLSRYSDINKDYVNIKIRSTIPGEKYYYKVTFFDNQYNKEVVEGSFISPTKSSDDTLVVDRPTILTKYANTTLSGTLNLTSMTSSGLILGNNEDIVYGSGGEVRLLAKSGTYIQELRSKGNVKWDGVFITPKIIDKNNFMPVESEFNSGSLLGSKIAKLFKVGSDTLGVGMKLNKNVEIEVDNIDSSKNYVILSSEDGVDWIKNNQGYTITGNKLTFTTDHFTLFAIVEVDSEGNPVSENATDEPPVQSSTRSGGGGGASRLTKDICLYGDYSISYYDKTCGIDPESINIDHMFLSNDGTSEMQDNEGLKNWTKKSSNEMKKAYYELMIQESDKARIFEELFMEKTVDNESIVNDSLLDALENIKDSQKEILVLLREKLSSSMVGNHKIIHIKGSKLNSVFEKIAILLIKKNFSEEKTSELFKNLNKIIIHFAINELNSIQKEVKTKNLLLLKKSVKTLVRNYKNYNKQNTVIKTTKIKKEVPKVNKKETVKEKIIRLNNRKKQESMINK